MRRSIKRRRKLERYLIRKVRRLFLEMMELGIFPSVIPLTREGLNSPRVRESIVQCVAQYQEFLDAEAFKRIEIKGTIEI